MFAFENKRENTVPDKNVPGPGKYDPAPSQAKKNFNSTCGSASFASRVPNCNDRQVKSTSELGPGSYNTRRTKNGGQSTFGSTTTNDSEMFGGELVVHPFTKQAKRNDMWTADMRTPYTKQTFKKNPAPTAYFQTKNQHDIKQRLLNEEKPNVCFGSQEVRPCNRPATSTNPGPGQYFEQAMGDKLQRERDN